MNNQERILRYLSDQMSPVDKERFESELERSAEFSEQFNRVKEVFEDVKYSKDTEINEAYFDNLIPNVRSRLDLESNPRYKFTFKRGLALGFVMILLAFLVLRTNDTNITNGSLTSVSESDLSDVGDSTLDNYLNEYDFLTDKESASTDINDLESITSLDNELEYYLLNNTENYNLTSDDFITDNEIDQVISAISNKKIL